MGLNLDQDLYTGSYIAGLVQANLGTTDAEVASAGDRITVLTNGVLVANLDEETAATLIRQGMDVNVAGDLSHITMNLEYAARAKKAGGKAKAEKKEVKKRLTADQKRKAELDNGAVKYLTTPQASSLVKRIWQTFVESGEDFKYFPSFYRELDRLIGEYRVHTGVEKPEPLQLDDGEEEADDFDPDAIVGSLSAEEVANLEPLIGRGIVVHPAVMKAINQRRLAEEVANLTAQTEQPVEAVEEQPLVATA